MRRGFATISDLIRVLKLKGATVTSEAMGCQTAIAREIVDAGADYVPQVKGNQLKLDENIKASLAEALRRRVPGEVKPKLERHKEVDKGHGRIERRTGVLSRDLSGIENAAGWKGLSGVAIVAREVHSVTSGKVSKQTATAEDLARTICNHWAIETTLQWSLDVTWGEVGHRIIDRNGAANLARLRRLAHGIVKNATGYGVSMARVRLVCGWNPVSLLQVLAGQVIARKRKRRVLDPTRHKRVKTSSLR